MPRLLLIDDDREMSALLADSLAGEGFAVVCAGTAEQGLDRLAQEPVELVLLDVMLPGINGFEALRRIRAQGQVPVIMLTAKGEDVDRIVGLEIGADDYLPKPFNFRELVARIHAVLRRTAHPAPSPAVSVQRGLSVDLRARQVWRDGRPVDLTTSEFELLRALMQSPGEPVSREELCRTVFAREYTVFDRSIDNAVSSLRRKLGPTSEGLERIKTVRNVGYVYVEFA